MNPKEKLSTDAIAYIGVGSNLGDRAAYINQALAMMQSITGIKLIKISDLFETKPVGGPKDQGNYLNGVAMIYCQLPASALLELLLNIENKLGRTRTDHWGSRTIDLDILLYGDQKIDLPNLKIPHPLMTERLFVLEPLAQIAPDLVHPELGKTIKKILNELKTGK